MKGTIQVLQTAATFLLVLSLVACAGQPVSKEPPPSYTVHGVLRSLPDAGADPAEVLIRHEAIPGFTDPEGQVVGMEAMSMPFALSDPAMLDGFAQGDKLEIDFEVRFDARQLLWLTGARAVAEAIDPDAPTVPEESSSADSEAP